MDRQLLLTENLMCSQSAHSGAMKVSSRVTSMLCKYCVQNGLPSLRELIVCVQICQN